MPTEKSRALYRGRTDANGAPQEWLGPEPEQASLENSDGTVLRAAAPAEPAVPARHLTDDEYDALSTRNKERVREALTDDGKPLYDVRTLKEMAPTPSSTNAAHSASEEGK